MNPPGMSLCRADMERLAGIRSVAFAIQPGEAARWVEGVAPEDLVLVRRDGVIAGSLLLVPMAQFFGSRAVPMVGIASVAVSPEHRGQGVATQLMADTVRQLHREGVALSSLYPATQPVYRSAGYAVAGSRFEARLPLDRLSFRERGLKLSSFEDVHSVRALYQDFARHRNGYLERGSYIWKRVFHPRRPGGPTRAFLVSGREGPCGYLVVTYSHQRENYHRLVLSDLVALSEPAWLRLLSFLADHRSLGTEAVVFGPAWGPPFSLLHEQSFRLRLKHHWMVRIVHLQNALEERGYPVGLEAEVAIQVEDRLVEENSGSFLLRVSGGRARLVRGTGCGIRLTIEQLASLYTGFLTPWELGLAGEPAELSRLMAVFAGAHPCMPDAF